jgi:hypothetical protein
MRDKIIEILPINPPVGGHGSQAYREAQAANDTRNVRDRSEAPVVIPPPPVDELVPVPPPTQRRNFGPGPLNRTITSRRRD